MNSRHLLQSIVAGFCAALFTIAISPATAAPDNIKKVTEVEGITEYQMDNGMKILLFPDDSKPNITVNITYSVGSRHEGRGEAGMAHLLEHMVFKGTPTFPSIWGALEKHGANFNGTTWLDRTNYYETLPANEDNLNFALKMEADRMVNSLISGEELAKEMTVVRNEFERGENNPGGVLSERMMSTAFLWHNYGKSTIGNRSDIERVPVDNLRKFYKKYYQPDNATLAVVGKFKPDNVLELINKYFGSIAKPERVLEATYTEEPAQDGPRMVKLKRVGDVPVVGLIYHIPAGPHEEFPACDLLSGILTHQPSGRLYRRLVASGMATSVSGYAFALAEPGIVEFSADVAEGHEPEAVLAAMTEVIEGLAKEAIDQKDVDRAVAREMKGFKLAMTNSSRIGVRLSESIAQGDWRLMFVQRDRIEKVTAEDVKTVAAKYFVESNRTAGIFVPTDEPARATVPTRPDVAGLVANYVGREAVSKGEELKPDVEYIEERISRQTLPSGIKLALLPVETRGDSVQASFRLHYGDQESLTGNITADDMIASMLMRGTENKTYEELRDAIDALESRISVSAGRGMQGRLNGSIQSDRSSIIDSINLLAEIMQKPAFDEKEFEIIKNRLVSGIEQGMSDQQTLGFLAITRGMNPYPKGHIHHVPTLEEQLKMVEEAKLADVKSLYEKLVGASHMEIAVFGDFDADDVTKTIEDQFGSWKSPTPYKRIEKPYQPVAADTVKIDTPDKEMAMVAMGSAVEFDDEDPRYPAMVIGSYVLGQNPSSRLMTRLRHKGGLSYGANGGFNASSRDKRGQLMAMAICAPQNADKAMDAMNDEITKWIADGITQEELDEAKTSYELKYKSRLAGDRYLVGQMVSGLELDRTLHFQQNIVDKIQELSVADVQSAIQEILNGKAMITVKAGDPNPRADEAAAAEGEAPADKAAAGGPPMKGNPWEQLAQFDTNKDGKIEKKELPEQAQPFFTKMDRDGNGFVEQADFAAGG